MDWREGALIEAEKHHAVVLKFGSSVLRSEDDLPSAVHEIYRAWRDGAQVIVVVSALGDATDQLLRRASRICEQPEPAALAALLATGEATTVALLGLALDRAGIPTRILDPAQAGLRTRGDRLDAELVAVDLERLRAELQQGVVVLPGFIGRGEHGETTLLGRGGSDFTAVFLAQRLGARCILFKNVDGLYTADPTAVSWGQPRRFARATWETAKRVGGGIIQPKALDFAAAHRFSFIIAAPWATVWTEIGAGPDEYATERTPAMPVRIALLGCGTVGGGVYSRLAALAGQFEVIGVSVRNRERALSVGVPEGLIVQDPEALIDKPCDVVVELMGGLEPAATLVERALRARRHVVTANKALIAAKGEHLIALAAENGVRLAYSAAVGGALPALEAVARARAAGPIRSLSGVLNGTTNFILDQLASGMSWDEAVRAAQEEGYAEADPSLDLDGTDAAQKIVLLARAAFGVNLSLDEIEREGITRIDAAEIARARAEGKMIRLVASCERTADGVNARVRPQHLPQSHPLASTAGIENRLLIEPEAGAPLLIAGKGAGRWPTTESVLADLFDIRWAAQQVSSNEEVEECIA
jgi:homoserine dehydrogenase